RAFRQHGDITVVVLNQADRLSPADASRCVADLTGLLAADGLPEVPVFAVSAVADNPGSTQLRAVLEAVVAARQAALSRLSADLDEVATGLSDVVGEPLGPVRWLALLGGLGGLGWLIARLAGGSTRGLGLPVVLAVAGLALWLLIAVLSGPAVAARARAARRRADHQLRSVVDTLTREYL